MKMNHHKNGVENVSCAVITVSDTRTTETDKSGKRITEMLTEAGHLVNLYQIIPDEKEQIRLSIEKTINNDNIQAIIVNGGTGISYRDVTIESIEPLFDKQIPGFGELFRLFSYKYDIGTASILSRAICGVANHRLIFSIPGSTGAVTLAMERIILPEIRHMINEIHKDLT